MSIWAIRVFFALIMGGLGWQVARTLELNPFWGILAAVAFFGVIAVVEAFVAKDSPAGFAAVVMGLVVGIALGWLVSYISTLSMTPDDEAKYGKSVKLILTALCCYFCIAVIFKTRERFRFIIPYVEFRRQHRGINVMLLDTSAIVDGRLFDMAEIGMLESPLVVPDFVLSELHGIADSPERPKRRRGRRALDILNKLRSHPRVDVEIYYTENEEAEDVDTRLIALAKELDARLVTCDRNLQRLAELQSVDVFNLNELASALKPVVLPGEELNVEIVRRGEEPDQGIGFLEDGTMVVVEGGSSFIGKELTVEITRSLQSSSGKLFFARPKL